MRSERVYKLVCDLANLSSMNDKKELLRMHNDVYTKMIFEHAYNPHKVYYIKSIPDGWVGEGYKGIDDLGFKILKLLATGTYRGDKAKKMISNYQLSLTPNSATLFRKILLKSLDCGLQVKSINAVFPGLIPVTDVMLAKVYKADKIQGRSYMSPKLDGVRAKHIKGKFYTRNGKELIGLRHIAFTLGDSDDIDGELMILNTPFHKASGLIRNKYNTPQAVFCMFDLPNMDAPFHMRYTKLIKMFPRAIGSVHVIPHFLVNPNDIYNVYKHYRSQGYEGAMVKSPNHRYQAGKRSWDWMKMKNVSSTEVIVLAIFEGKGKYKDQMGGVICDYKGINVEVGSGFSDAQRKYFYHNPADIIEHTIEVLYHEVTPSGSLREPRFLRFREDL